MLQRRGIALRLSGLRLRGIASWFGGLLLRGIALRFGELLPLLRFTLWFGTLQCRLPVDHGSEGSRRNGRRWHGGRCRSGRGRR
ncbi:hypothetical protein [Paraburkholderia solisilvae]|uniref:hypothetical protein n=1 Tax=Paraburkholderia solisilvae TaxID=624376 RepID=UPI0015829EDE|nr:hypothetical protein [Paraburkholderia solisilvae]